MGDSFLNEGLAFIKESIELALRFRIYEGEKGVRLFLYRFLIYDLASYKGQHRRHYNDNKRGKSSG